MSDPRRWDGTDLGLGHSGDAVDQLDGGSLDIVVDAAAGVAISGTYTPGATADGRRLARVVSAAVDSAALPVPVHPAYHTKHGRRSNVGVKPISLVAQYEVGVADLDDVQLRIVKIVQGADGSAAVVSTLAGDVDADYDSAHDSAAERASSTGLPRLHTATVTAPAGERAFLREGEQLGVVVVVDGSATGTFVLKACRLKCARVLTDVVGG